MEFEQILWKTYNRLSALAMKESIKENYGLSLKYIATAAEFMYSYNPIYTDKNLDNLLSDIGNKILCVKKYDYALDTILFYDHFGMDNRGLSLIYVRALKQLGYKIIYLTKNSNRKRYCRTEQVVKESGGKTICVNNSDFIKNMKRVNLIIQNEKPQHIFIHATPDDVDVLSTFSVYKGIATRFQINLTDHGFWLGTNALDYCIEFREVGAIKSYRSRKISKKKIMILPYYPASNKEIQFKGFNFAYHGHRIIYSGGAFYKLYGSEKYFAIAKHILDKYDDTILYFTGSGDSTILKKWIKDNNFQKRFIVENERTDLDHVMERCYFYLNTYPFEGGLMTQYAVKNGKIPVTYIDDVNRLKQIFIGDSDKYEFLFDNFRELIVRIDELLDNEDKVNEIKDKIGELLISEDQFKDELKKCIDNHTTSFTYDMKEDDHLDYKKTSLDRCADDYDLLFKILDKKISNLSYEKFFYLHIYHKGKILLNRLWKNKERR